MSCLDHSQAQDMAEEFRRAESSSFYDWFKSVSPFFQFYDYAERIESHGLSDEWIRETFLSNPYFCMEIGHEMYNIVRCPFNDDDARRSLAVAMSFIKCEFEGTMYAPRVTRYVRRDVHYFKSNGYDEFLSKLADSSLPAMNRILASTFAIIASKTSVGIKPLVIDIRDTLDDISRVLLNHNDEPLTLRSEYLSEVIAMRYGNYN